MKNLSMFALLILSSMTFATPAKAQSLVSQLAKAQSASDVTSMFPVPVTIYGTVGDGSTDDTAAIQRVINRVAATAPPHNGGAIFLPPGIYRVSGLSIPSYIELYGAGRAVTVIQLKPGTSTDVISIPLSTFFSSIHDMTIDGNKGSGGVGNCIDFAATGAGDGGNSNAWTKGNQSVVSYRTMDLYNLVLSNCSQNGLLVNSSNFNIDVHDIYTLLNGLDGIQVDGGTDSTYHSIYTEGNGRTGIFNSGSNNHFSDVKSIWNGLVNNAYAGVWNEGDRNMFASIEAQDNYTNGIVDSGWENQWKGFLSDSNGYATNGDSTSGVAAGIAIGKRTSSGGYGGKGVYEGRVTAYRGTLEDGKYATQYPYTLDWHNAPYAAQIIGESNCCNDTTTYGVNLIINP